MGSRVLVCLHPAIQATGRLALAPAGLAPARHTCLIWTRDGFVGPRQHRRRDRQPEGLGGLQIDDHFELGGPLDRQVGGLRTLEDLVHESNITPRKLISAGLQGHETPGIRKSSGLVDRWQPVPCSEADYPASLPGEQGIGDHQQCS
jgi:hypothetical protein